MYNRYVPQSDGSYHRNRVPDPPEAPPPVSRETPPPPKHDPPSKPSQPAGNREDLGGFLRRLLPRSFDTGDLIVVLLLLLMAADCQEEQNSALLTLALYLFL